MAAADAGDGEAPLVGAVRPNARLHVLPAFKNHRVRLVTRAQIKRLLITKLGEGYARPTVALILSTLRSLLNAALEDGIIASNPSARLGRALKLQAPPERDVEQVKAFTREELAKVFECAKNVGQPCGPLF